MKQVEYGPEKNSPVIHNFLVFFSKFFFRKSTYNVFQLSCSEEVTKLSKWFEHVEDVLSHFETAHLQIKVKSESEFVKISFGAVRDNSGARRYWHCADFCMRATDCRPVEPRSQHMNWTELQFATSRLVWTVPMTSMCSELSDLVRCIVRSWSIQSRSWRRRAGLRAWPINARCNWVSVFSSCAANGALAVMRLLVKIARGESSS